MAVQQPFDPRDVFFSCIVALCRQNGGTFSIPRTAIPIGRITLNTTLTPTDVIIEEVMEPK